MSDAAKSKRSFGIFRRDDSELIMAIGPLEIYRGSNLMLDEKARSGLGPRVCPFYTVAINPGWLDHGGQVELCIDEQVRIVGTKDVLEEDADLLVQVGEGCGRYHILVMDKDKSLTTHLEVERAPEPDKPQPIQPRRSPNAEPVGERSEGSLEAAPPEDVRGAGEVMREPLTHKPPKP